MYEYVPLVRHGLRSGGCEEAIKSPNICVGDMEHEP